MAAKDDVVERTRARLAEARGRLARLSRGGDSARGDDSTRGGHAFVGLDAESSTVFDPFDTRGVSRESSMSLEVLGAKSPRDPAPKSPREWNYGAKDARSPNATRRLSRGKDEIARGTEKGLTQTQAIVALPGASPQTPVQTASVLASAVAAAATARVSKASKASSFVENEKEKDDAKKKPHWASPSREYVKARSGVDAFATPFAKAKPEHVLLAAADAAAEIKRLREALDTKRAETERAERELADTRERSRAAMRAGAEEAERRAGAETQRLRDALTKADAELLRTRAELRAASNALAKSDAALTRERLGMARAVSETRDSARRESASSARVAASRALELQADRDLRVSEAHRGLESERAESARLRDALGEARGALDASEAERFELRRALEAHVGALVEAKVDEAERAGELEAMREDMDDMRRRYEAAATRALELETRERRARDSGRFERLVTISGGDATSPRAARKSPRASSSAKGRLSSPHAHRRSPSPHRRGGSPRSSRRSAGSDETRVASFTEKIDVD